MNSTSPPNPRAGANFRAYSFLTLTSLCWGANTIFGRLAVGEISPMMLVSLRWLGALTLMVVFARRYVRQDWPVLRANLPFVAIMGALGFATFNSLFYVAAHSTTAVNLGILQGAVPAFVLIGLFAVYRIRVTGLQASGVLITMLGVALVAAAGDLSRLAALAINRGDLLMVIACMLYAGYTVALRRRPAVSPLGLFTLLAAAAFITSLPYVAVEAMLGQFQAPTPTGWVIVVLVSMFPSFLAQVCFIEGVGLIGPGRAGIFVNLVPVFAAIMAVTYLGEPFEIFHAIALTLVLVGIWLSERGGTE